MKLLHRAGRLFSIVVFILASCTVYASQLEFVASSKELFAHPHDLELDPSGQWLYVADVNNHEVKILNPVTLEIIKGLGKGELNSPHDVHFDDGGRLLVADSGNDRIAIYAVDGLNARFAGELVDGLSSPEGVTSAPGDTVFVTSTGNHTVLKFQGGKLVKKIGGRGDGKLEFVRPHDIEMGSDGLLYVADPGNGRIQILSDSLSYLSTLRPNKKPFNEPKYLALDERNNLYVADQQNNMLRIFDDARNEMATVTAAGARQLNYIEGVETDKQMIWVADTYNNRIVLFRWLP